MHEDSKNKKMNAGGAKRKQGVQEIKKNRLGHKWCRGAWDQRERIRTVWFDQTSLI